MIWYNHLFIHILFPSLANNPLEDDKDGASERSFEYASSHFAGIDSADAREQDYQGYWKKNLIELFRTIIDVRKAMMFFSINESIWNF